MNFLVLGGNGYIGSKIVRILINEGHMVVCTKRDKSNLNRIEDIKDDIIWISASVDALDATLQYTSFDYVLNMACNYGRGNVLYDNVIEANIEFPLSIINRAVESGTKNFITLGTGLPDNFNMYAFSKKMFSSFGEFYAQKHQINFACLKLEMFYGADEPKDRFLPTIIQQMLNGETVETTEGTQKRDIISADDVVKAIMMVITSMPQGFNEISVGTGNNPSISEIVDFIWKETGKKSIIHKGTIPMRPNEPDCVADTSKLCLLGPWEPIAWKSGIKMHFVRFYMDY